MQKYYLRITGWYQELHPQKKIGLKLMILGVLLGVYAILGMAGVVPNPLPHRPS